MRTIVETERIPANEGIQSPQPLGDFGAEQDGSIKMAEYGVYIGGVLLLAVAATAWLLAAKAAKGVETFREEHHVSFLDRKDL